MALDLATQTGTHSSGSISLAADQTSTHRRVAAPVRALPLAPSFDLPDVLGSWVSLSDRLALGPVVLTFVYGDWWPFAHELPRHLMAGLPWIEGLGATLIAVAPDGPSRPLTRFQIEALPISVVVDAGSRLRHAIRTVVRAHQPIGADVLGLSPSAVGAFVCVIDVDQTMPLCLDLATQAPHEMLASVISTLRTLAARQRPAPRVIKEH